MNDMLILVDLLLIMNLNHCIALIILILACTAQNSTASSEQAQIAAEVTQMDGPVLAEEAKEEEQIKKQLQPFIFQEFKELKLNRDTFKESESFLISIPSGGSHEFRYKIQSNPNPTIMLKLFTQENGDDIAIIKDHDIENYVDILTSTNLFGEFSSVAKAYARKIARLGSYSGSELFVRLENRFEREMIVEVRLSGPPIQVDRFNVATNSHFSVAAKKLEAIRDEMKEVEDINRFKFKFQWGFLEREERYEQQMLKLTGVEAFVILVTSIVQLYCIKALMDKNGII